MAASQGCWARGLDGPWACGREDLSSGSSRAWLAGLDPCVVVQRSASQCMLKLQLQMQYQWQQDEMSSLLYADGAVEDGHGHGYLPAICLYASIYSMPSQPAPSRPPPQTHRQHCSVHARRLHDLVVVRLGQLRCSPAPRWWPGGREAPFGGTWLCGFPH